MEENYGFHLILAVFCGNYAVWCMLYQKTTKKENHYAPLKYWILGTILYFFYIQGLKFAYQRQNAWELVLLNTFLVSASTMLLWKFFQKLEAIEEVSEYKKLYIAVSILSLIACVVLCYLFQDAVLVGIVSNVFVPLIMSALAELLG